MLIPILLVLALLIGACAAAARVPPGIVIGQPIEPRPVLTFAEVDADPGAHFEQTLLVEATVTAVCKKAGCWMQIEDAGRTAMVRWETGCGGRYVFPPDVVGRRVLVQGSFYPKAISADDAEHLREESSGTLALEREGYEFNASAVLLLESSG